MVKMSHHTKMKFTQIDETFRKHHLPHWWIWGACLAHAPYGTKFFHFRIHFQQKVPELEVHAPQWVHTPLRVHTPLQEILDLPLFLHVYVGWGGGGGGNESLL